MKRGLILALILTTLAAPALAGKPRKKQAKAMPSRPTILLPNAVQPSITELNQMVKQVGVQGQACPFCVTGVSNVQFSKRQLQPPANSVFFPRANFKWPQPFPNVQTQSVRDPFIAKFHALSGQAVGLSQEAIQNTLRFMGSNLSRITNRNVVTVIDYSQPSSSKRMYVFDLRENKVTREWVAHGSGSDPKHTGVAQKFSNEGGSYATPPGFFLTQKFYPYPSSKWKEGALKLIGLEAANSNAFSRAIVMHAAWYVSDTFLRQHGKMGRSQGCPAVTKEAWNRLLPKLPGGSLIYSYGRQS